MVNHAHHRRPSALWLLTGLCVWGAYVLVHQSLLVPDVDPGNRLQVIAWLAKSFIFGSLPAALLLGCLLLLPARSPAHLSPAHPLGMMAVAVILTGYFAALLAITIYFRYFGDIPFPGMLVERWRETWSIRHQISGQLLQGKAIAVLLLGIASLAGLMAGTVSKGHAPRPAVWIFISVSLVCNAGFLGYKGVRGDLREDLRFGYTNIAQARGIGFAYGSMLYQAWRPAQGRTTPTPFPGKINPDRDVSAIVRLPDHTNLILLQIESLDPSVIDMQVGGQAITPFLNRFKSRSLFFPNFIAQHSGGGTSDCELSVLTSLLPSNKGGGFRTARYERIHGLPAVLDEHGYTSAVLHPNYASYFYRNLGFSKLGFDYYFHESYFSGKARGMFALDKPFLEQCVGKILSLPAPFYAHIITIQSHGPFGNVTNAEFRRSLKSAMPEGRGILLDYLAVMHEVDGALETFFSLLRKHDLVDNTLVVLFSDHLSSVLDHRASFERIPLMLSHPQLPARQLTEPGSHIDIAPTITALLGIPEPVGWLGTALLPSDPQRVALINGPVRIYQKGSELNTIVNTADIRYLSYSSFLLGR